MALFSRKKSKAKKADQEEEKKKAAADAKAKAPQRGRNGKIIASKPTADETVMHDIPAPSQLPRDFGQPQNRPLEAGRGRSYSFDEHNQAEDDKHDDFDPHLSSDSGYASPGPGPQGLSRTASAQHPRRGRDCLAMSNKSMPQLTLGEDFAQEPTFADHPALRGDSIDRNNGHRRQASGGRSLQPSRSLQAIRDQAGSDRLGPLPTPQSHQHQDGRQQRMIQQSMPMRPSSVPAQALQPRHERVNRPPPQRSFSPGPVLQNTYTGLTPRSRASAPLDSNSPFDWQSSPTRNHQLQSSQVGPRSPTSPTAHKVNPSFDQDEFSPSLNILNGLKVNKRGLILDEEGDPVGELFEGDIIDCVRQKADPYGDVLDEYGRVVGRVRTLSVMSTGTSLHRSGTNASNVEHRREASPAPPVPALKSAPVAHGFDQTQHIDSQQYTQPSNRDFAQSGSSSSPTEPTFATSQRDNINHEDYVSTEPYGAQDSELPQRQGGEQVAQRQEPSSPRRLMPGSSIHRSESLPSVPESHSTAEVALSDDGTSASEEGHHATSEHGSEHLSGNTAAPEQVVAHHGNTMSAKAVTIQQPQILTNNHIAPVRTAAMSHEQPSAMAHQTEEPTYVPSTPPFTRSASERVPPTTGLPPVPAIPRTFSESKKPAYAQQAGFPAPLNRGKSSPLPAFPGRQLSVGLAVGGYNGPMPGVPNRRLTASGFPVSHGMGGMPGVNGQSPLNKSRTSTPLVRSPLSSHETSPPESVEGSTKGYFKPTYTASSQPQGHSRSQSLQTGTTTPSTTGAGGKPRKVFGHAAGKQADIVVNEVGDDKKTEKKKKKGGMKALFGRKKAST